MPADRYDKEGSDLYNQYSMTSDLYNQEYGHYRDDVSDWKDEYDRAQSAYDNERSFDYGQYTDMLSYWQQAAAQENSAYMSQKEYELALAQFNWQKAQAAAKSSSGGSSSRSSGSSKSSSKSSSSSSNKSSSNYSADYQQAIAALAGIPKGSNYSSSGTFKSAINYLVNERGLDPDAVYNAAIKYGYKPS